MQKNDQNHEIYDSEKVCKLHDWKRHHAINERLKRIWFWIEKDKVWAEFHEKFDEFKDDYSLNFFELKLRIKACVVRRRLKE